MTECGIGGYYTNTLEDSSQLFDFLYGHNLSTLYKQIVRFLSKYNDLLRNNIITSVNIYKDNATVYGRSCLNWNDDSLAVDLLHVQNQANDVSTSLCILWNVPGHDEWLHSRKSIGSQVHPRPQVELIYTIHRCCKKTRFCALFLLCFMFKKVSDQTQNGIWLFELGLSNLQIPALAELKCLLGARPFGVFIYHSVSTLK